MNNSEENRYALFGDCGYDRKQKKLYRNGQPQKIPRSLWRLLDIFLERARITHDQLWELLWKERHEGRVVEDSLIVKAVSELGQLLGKREDYIITSAKNTYEFIADVSYVSASQFQTWRESRNDTAAAPAADVVTLTISDHCRNDDAGLRIASEPYISLAKLPRIDRLLVGRDRELNELDKLWRHDGTGVVLIKAAAGYGKTALVINWFLERRAPGASKVLGWSFFSQGAEDSRQASAAPFLEYALRTWFNLADVPHHSWDRGELLAQLIRKERVLLLLDGLEPIQFPPGPEVGTLRDPGMQALLKELATANPGLCICTSRLPLTDLAHFAGRGLFSIDLDNLNEESGGEYLKLIGVKADSDQDFQLASRDVDNHALALTLLGNYLVRYCEGNIQRRDTLPPLLGDAAQGGHARRILRQYQHWFDDKPELHVLRLMSLFDGPVAMEDLRTLSRIPPDDFSGALHNLTRLRLLAHSDRDLDCHPLIREHFAEEFRTHTPDLFRNSHSVLYDKYARRIESQPTPSPDVIALSQITHHGCQADRDLEAFSMVYGRSRADLYFLELKSTPFTVDLSLLVNFFQRDWQIPSPKLPAEDQAWISLRAGFELFAVGRLGEALAPLNSAALAFSALQRFGQAALALSYLSEVHLYLGALTVALDISTEAIAVADRSEYDYHRIICRMAKGQTLHELGQLEEAGKVFGEAEAIQASWVKHGPHPYSLRRHRYFDYLLSLGKRSVVITALATFPDSDSVFRTALDHLTLGRAYSPTTSKALSHINQAIDGLRRTEARYRLPDALLTRAMIFRHREQFDRARHDLDEVFRLAKARRMLLALIDYYFEDYQLLMAHSSRTHRLQAAQDLKQAETLIASTRSDKRAAELNQLRSQQPRN